jgi:anti-sigma factor RsiW
MSDMWTDRLSEYLDDELAPAERVALAAHLERCPECSATLADLRRVVARARALEPGGPGTDLWPGIAQRIGAGPAPARPARRERFRRVTLSLPQLLAAGIALMVLSGGSVWLLHPGARAAGQAPIAALPGAPAATSGAAAGSTGTAVSWQRRAAPGYDAAVAELEQVLQQGRGRLDSTTVRVLEQNLQVIDRAIEQARRAVAADSANAYLNSHLAETMRRKLDLLRQAASLVSAAS